MHTIPPTHTQRFPTHSHRVCEIILLYVFEMVLQFVYPKTCFREKITFFYYTSYFFPRTHSPSMYALTLYLA